MKYSLRSLMITVLVVPPLLAGAYFAVMDERLRPVVIAILLGSGFVLAALTCGGIFALGQHVSQRMKFSIRNLLLVTVIVALTLGWWVERRGLKSQILPPGEKPVTALGGVMK